MASKTGDRTYSVVQAGAMAGLGRQGSYRAAKMGQIPTIKLGSKLRVPAILWDRILDGQVFTVEMHSAAAKPIVGARGD
ncbi:hypothetical protein [Bradyrhizobium sp. RT3b]|uniref:hypothetical protein n=1 Tax=Bradyrhizobium sp. RT3b TaxID=3156334 RepID=UPI003394FAE1